MQHEFPPAVPEVPVASIDTALAYYTDHLGFTLDWRGDDGGIAGISKGNCRIFLAGTPFRQRYGNAPPVVVWLNLDNKQEVDELHQIWDRAGARIVSVPESKPWKLHEFTAADVDGNFFRVFYDFSRDA